MTAVIFADLRGAVRIKSICAMTKIAGTKKAARAHARRRARERYGVGMTTGEILGNDDHTLRSLRLCFTVMMTSAMIQPR
jgi:hypothetical protein